MGYEAKKTEHSGAKHGNGAYWGYGGTPRRNPTASGARTPSARSAAPSPTPPLKNQQVSVGNQKRRLKEKARACMWFPYGNQGSYTAPGAGWGVTLLPMPKASLFSLLGYRPVTR